ncbi:MAG: hypothetical protein K6A79_09610, partial [Ruminococcus sp.]|nr:hypothetical protein [Ruminococcus sp.]
MIRKNIIKIKKERLHPGKILLVDTRAKRIFYDEEVKERY